MKILKENVIKVLKVKPRKHPEVCMLKNTLDENVYILLNDEEKLIGLEVNRRIGSDI